MRRKELVKEIIISSREPMEREMSGRAYFRGIRRGGRPAKWESKRCLNIEQGSTIFDLRMF